MTWHIYRYCIHTICMYVTYLNQETNWNQERKWTCTCTEKAFWHLCHMDEYRVRSSNTWGHKHRQPSCSWLPWQASRFRQWKTCPAGRTCCQLHQWSWRLEGCYSHLLWCWSYHTIVIAWNWLCLLLSWVVDGVCTEKHGSLCFPSWGKINEDMSKT